MTTAHQYLFKDMQDSTEDVGFTGWQDRLHTLRVMSDTRGGLLPRAILHEALGVSRQRIGEMCSSGVLEVINFCGVQFITGRSLADYKQSEKHKGGYGVKLTRWQGIKIGVGMGKALADVACPD